MLPRATMSPLKQDVKKNYSIGAENLPYQAALG
jgi:hypothetical protein